MKLFPRPAAPVPGIFGSEENFINSRAAVLMRSEGIWLFGNAVPVSGSRIAGRPLKFPLFRAAVGMAEMTVVDWRRRSPSKLPKKKSLFLRIGPPNDPPNSFRLKAGLGRLVAKKFLAESTRFRLNANR